jgi:hypothetical protein
MLLASHWERVLWCVSSITCLPGARLQRLEFLYGGLVWLTSAIPGSIPVHNSWIFLLALSLRSLPPVHTKTVSVSWTTLIPHVQLKVQDAHGTSVTVSQKYVRTSPDLNANNLSVLGVQIEPVTLQINPRPRSIAHRRRASSPPISLRARPYSRQPRARRPAYPEPILRAAQLAPGTDDGRTSGVRRADVEHVVRGDDCASSGD